MKQDKLGSVWESRLKLRAEGNKLWAEAILQVYGNIKMEWKNYNKKQNDYECHLENGKVFKP